jgi:hypothetical protein
MAISKLAAKLKIKAGNRIAVLNAPEGYRQELGKLPENVELSPAPNGKFDAVHLFVRDGKELRRDLPVALNALKPGGIFWVAYPKGTSGIQTDLTRDLGWEPVDEAGLRGVSLISIDETWTGVWFRKAEETVLEDPVEAQYAGKKAGLRPIYERLVQIALHLGQDVQLAPRKTYVGLARKKLFAVIQPSTNTRVDLGLKLRDRKPTVRLVDAPGLGSGSITHKVSLSSLADIDDEVVSWLGEAYRGIDK